MNDQKKFGSRGRMVFGHFNRTQAILPTPEQILFGIVLAQVDQLKDDPNTNFKCLIGHIELWQKIFDMVKEAEFCKPLTPEILSDPKHKFVKTLVYIYSMQSFVFKEMNKTSRTKDISKIKFYGPLASALSFAVYCGNKDQTGLANEFSVYRGLQVST